MGIEPTSEAWEASILPLYDARSSPIIRNKRRAGIVRNPSAQRLGKQQHKGAHFLFDFGYGLNLSCTAL